MYIYNPTDVISFFDLPHGHLGVIVEMAETSGLPVGTLITRSYQIDMMLGEPVIFSVGGTGIHGGRGAAWRSSKVDIEIVDKRFKVVDLGPMPDTLSELGV